MPDLYDEMFGEVDRWDVELPDDETDEAEEDERFLDYEGPDVYDDEDEQE